MCRNIKPLFNYDPPATDEDIHQAALQFVRKISGYTKPSKANEEAFAAAVESIANDSRTLLNLLVTDAQPHDREAEIARRRAQNAKRFPA